MFVRVGDGNERVVFQSDGGLAALIAAAGNFNQFVRHVDPETLDPEFFTQAQVLLADLRGFVDELEGEEKAYLYRIIPLGCTSWRGRLIDDVLKAAGGELEITPSSVKKVYLFSSTDDVDTAHFGQITPINGAYFPARKAIALSDALDAASLVRTTAHELAHHAGLDEVGAHKFAAQFAAKFGSQIISPPAGYHVTIGDGPYICVETERSR